jgi:iron complex outermembrane receptor protein
MLTSIELNATCQVPPPRGTVSVFTKSGALIVAGVLYLGSSPVWCLDLGRTVAFSIPAQSLDSALVMFGRQANLQAMIAPDSVRGLKASAVSGTLSAGAALTELLDASGLRYEQYGDAVTVFSGSPSSVSKAIATITADHEQSAFSTDKTNVNDDSPANPTDVGPQDNQRGQHKTQLEQVTVTAQKREERLQDVPIPMTAVSADTLLESNQTGIQDFYNLVPGLTISSDGYHSLSSLAIRGISPDGFGNPTVGITIDDVPLGAPTTFGYGQFAPDIDPNDLAGIEVLRGPQGTLYGANSLGGLLKYVTADPSTAAWSGRFQTGLSSIYNGAQLGYEERGSVNAPISDTLAVRLSAFTRLNPGYIDDPSLGERGVNWSDSYGGRFAMLWEIVPAVTLRISALLQDSIQHGSPYVDVGPGFGDLQQDYAHGTGVFGNRIQVYTAKLTAKLAGVDITSVSGYSVNSLNLTLDATPFFGSVAESYFQVAGGAITELETTRMFTQEVRLSSSIGQHFDWLLGGFYERANTPDIQIISAVDPVTGFTAGQLGYLTDPATYKEYAAFADLTLHFTDQFDVQLGGRESHNTQTYQGISSGPLCGCETAVVGPVEHSNDSAFTYLVSPRFKLSPDLMLYARLASGYRPGGPNTPNPGIPPQFNHDTTVNYEVGVKGNALDHTLSFDASIYYIDWKDIQLSVLSPAGYGYYANGSTAKSEGAEISIEARPVRNFRVSSWIAWNEAILTAPLPSGATAVGASGDRLPNAARISGNVSLEQQFPLGRGATGFVGGSLSYVGDQESVFTTTTQRQAFPGYGKADIRAGILYDSWAFNFYINNVADRRAAIAGGIGTGAYPNAFIDIPPRTVGASFSKKLAL